MGCNTDIDKHENCCGCCHEHEHDHDEEAPEHGLTAGQKKKLGRIFISATILILVQVLKGSVLAHPSGIDFGNTNFLICLALYAASYLIAGYDILWRAIKNILRGQIFDENFLMTVATLGAIALGFMGDGDFVEAVTVMLFYQLGEWFEGYAVGKSRRNITNLMDIRPDYANVEKDGKLVKVDPDTLAVGSIIVVQPGEKIPLDGEVIGGTSTINTSALTGESAPKTVGEGEEVVSGCIAMNGMLKIKTTKTFGDSTVSKILDLVENAAEKKSHSENFITKFARIYTPIVCISAACLAVLPSLFFIALGQNPEWFTWIYRALTFLVISCPCALVISIPLSFFAGIGCASKNGILVKGSSYLENLANLKTVVFDKTGTLTKGVFTVVDAQVLEESDISVSELKRLAAYAESASSHPIARSIVSAYDGEIDRKKMTGLSETGGQGVQAVVEGRVVRVGKVAFADAEKNRPVPNSQGAKNRPVPNSQGATQVFVSIDGQMAGNFSIADVVKETSADAISDLKSLGINKTVMLTGDNEQTARAVAEQLELDEYHANLLPEDKVSAVEKLSKAGLCGFVGDGINDAPVLMRSDVGIAMGAMGSDAAIEAADVVLMDDNPEKVARSIQVARKSMRIVHQNIVFAIGIKVLFLLLGAIGFMNMYGAIFADVGVMVLAVLNAMRCLRA